MREIGYITSLVFISLCGSLPSSLDGEDHSNKQTNLGLQVLKSAVLVYLGRLMKLRLPVVQKNKPLLLVFLLMTFPYIAAQLIACTMGCLPT